MKTIFRLSLLATLFVAVSSCSKSSIDNNTFTTTMNTTPILDSRIYRFINVPAPMELGDPDAIIHEGNTMTIYLPYVMDNEQLQSATLTLTDEATGLPINTFDMVSSTDPSAEQLDPPDGLREAPFMFVTFTAESEYTYKTISISTTMTGAHITSTNVLSAAFFVQP